jgi:hypothetical protein
MIGRTQMTHWVDDGSAGALAHLLEVAEKKLRESLAVRNAAQRDVTKARQDIRRFQAQRRTLTQAHHGRR